MLSSPRPRTRPTSDGPPGAWYGGQHLPDPRHLRRASTDALPAARSQRLGARRRLPPTSASASPSTPFSTASPPAPEPPFLPIAGAESRGSTGRRMPGMLASDAVRVGTAASGSGRAPRVLIRPAHALAATGLAALALLLALFVARPAGVQRQPLIPVARPAGPAGQQVARLPAAALAPVSNAVGAADPAYRVDLSHGGLAATSAAQRMRIRFAATGISLTSRARRECAWIRRALATRAP